PWTDGCRAECGAAAEPPAAGAAEDRLRPAAIEAGQMRASAVIVTRMPANARRVRRSGRSTRSSIDRRQPQRAVAGGPGEHDRRLGVEVAGQGYTGVRRLAT